jgi:hypothetical protein
MSRWSDDSRLARGLWPSAGKYSAPSVDTERGKLWNGMSRVSAMVWHTAQKTPLLPDSVFRRCSSRLAKAIRFRCPRRG